MIFQGHRAGWEDLVKSLKRTWNGDLGHGVGGERIQVQEHPSGRATWNVKSTLSFPLNPALPSLLILTHLINFAASSLQLFSLAMLDPYLSYQSHPPTNSVVFPSKLIANPTTSHYFHATTYSKPPSSYTWISPLPRFSASTLPPFHLFSIEQPEESHKVGSGHYST